MRPRICDAVLKAGIFVTALAVLLVCPSGPAPAQTYDAPGYNALGLAYLNEGDPASAMSSFNSAITMDDELADAYANRAMALLWLDQYQAALTDAQEAIDLYTLADQCQFGYEPGEYLSQYLSSVITQVQSANTTNSTTTTGSTTPSSSAAGSTTDTDSVTLTTSTTTTPTSTTTTDKTNVTSSSSSGSSSVKLSTVNEAERTRRQQINQLNAAIIEDILEITACNLAQVTNAAGIVRATYLRALAEIELESYGEAVEDLTWVIEKSPQSAELYAARCEAYVGLGSTGLALSDCNQALSLDPELEEAYLARGDYWLAMGDATQALADYNQAMAVDPASAEPYIHVGRMYLDQGNPPAAIDALNAAIQRDPQSAEAYEVRSEAWTAEAAAAQTRGQNDRASQAQAYAQADSAKAAEIRAKWATIAASLASPGANDTYYPQPGGTGVGPVVTQ